MCLGLLTNEKMEESHNQCQVWIKLLVALTYHETNVKPLNVHVMIPNAHRNMDEGAEVSFHERKFKHRREKVDYTGWEERWDKRVVY